MIFTRKSGEIYETHTYPVYFRNVHDRCLRHTGTLSVDVNTLIGAEWVLEDPGGRGVEDRVQSTIIFQATDRIQIPGIPFFRYSTIQLATRPYAPRILDKI